MISKDNPARLRGEIARLRAALYETKELLSRSGDKLFRLRMSQRYQEIRERLGNQMSCEDDLRFLLNEIDSL